MQTGYFERPEGALAYSDYGGAGPLVLMFPGMGALRSEYRYLAPKLVEAGYRAVAVDLRGHGGSSARWTRYDVPALGADMLALVEYFGASAAHLVCTSKAAAAGVWAAAEAPERVRSLVLIGAFARRADIDGATRALFWLLMHNPWRAQTWTAYYRLLYPSQKPPDFDAYMAELSARLKEPGRFKAIVAVGAASFAPAEDRLDRVRAPTLVIMGTEDPDFPDPIAEGQAIAERTRGRLERIEGAGHYPQTEMPEKTAPLVVDFLRRASQRPAPPPTAFVEHAGP
jgi:pimeloyl-ACP methyl ester carboxylesterase